jgi:hypothetical protein
MARRNQAGQVIREIPLGCKSSNVNDIRADIALKNRKFNAVFDAFNRQSGSFLVHTELLAMLISRE